MANIIEDITRRALTARTTRRVLLAAPLSALACERPEAVDTVIDAVKNSARAIGQMREENLRRLTPTVDNRLKTIAPPEQQLPVFTATPVPKPYAQATTIAELKAENEKLRAAAAAKEPTSTPPQRPDPTVTPKPEPTLAPTAAPARPTEQRIEAKTSSDLTHYVSTHRTMPLEFDYPSHWHVFEDRPDFLKFMDYSENGRSDIAIRRFTSGNYYDSLSLEEYINGYVVQGFEEKGRYYKFEERMTTKSGHQTIVLTIEHPDDPSKLIRLAYLKDKQGIFWSMNLVKPKSEKGLIQQFFDGMVTSLVIHDEKPYPRLTEKGWQVFRSPNYLYQIDHPNNWGSRVDTVSGRKVDVLIGPTILGIGVQALIYAEPVDQSMTYEDYLKQKLELQQVRTRPGYTTRRWSQEEYEQIAKNMRNLPKELRPIIDGKHVPMIILGLEVGDVGGAKTHRVSRVKDDFTFLAHGQAWHIVITQPVVVGQPPENVEAEVKPVKNLHAKLVPSFQLVDKDDRPSPAKPTPTPTAVPRPAEKPAEAGWVPFDSINELYGLRLPLSYKPSGLSSGPLFVQVMKTVDSFEKEGSRLINVAIRTNMKVAAKPVIAGVTVENYVKQKIVDPMTELYKSANQPTRYYPKASPTQRVGGQDAIQITGDEGTNDPYQYTSVVFIGRGKVWVFNLSTHPSETQAEQPTFRKILDSFHFR